MNKLKMTFFAKDPSFTRNLAFYIFTATGNKQVGFMQSAIMVTKAGHNCLSQNFDGSF